MDRLTSFDYPIHLLTYVRVVIFHGVSWLGDVLAIKSIYFNRAYNFHRLYLLNLIVRGGICGSWLLSQWRWNLITLIEGQVNVNYLFTDSFLCCDPLDGLLTTGIRLSRARARDRTPLGEGTRSLFGDWIFLSDFHIWLLGMLIIN